MFVDCIFTQSINKKKSNVVYLHKNNKNKIELSQSSIYRMSHLESLLAASSSSSSSSSSSFSHFNVRCICVGGV